MSETGCIKTLIVESAQVLADNLVAELKHHLSVRECDFTHTLFKAVKSLVDEGYDLCLVSDAFPKKELQVFFRDIKEKVQRSGCVFALVQDKVGAEFDRSSLTEFGFQAVVSRKLSFDDMASLTSLLGVKLHACEVKQRVIDVEKALEMVFRELDQIAADKKRGATNFVNTLAMDFIALQTEFDEEILGRYFEALMSKTESVEKPLLNTKLELPDLVLARNLPKLSRETYSGASRRVWKSLVEMHGKGGPKRRRKTICNPFKKAPGSEGSAEPL